MKRFSSVLCAFLISFSLVTYISALAPEFDDPPDPVVPYLVIVPHDGSDVVDGSNFLDYCSMVNTDGHKWSFWVDCIYVNEPVDPIYCVAYGSQILLGSSSAFSARGHQVVFYSQNDYSFANNWSIVSSSENDINVVQAAVDARSVMTRYESRSDALEALSDLVTNGPPAPLTDKSVTIPIGYAAFLKASGTLTLRCTFPSNSALFSGTSGWWGDTHQTIGSAAALPAASFQFPVADAIQIYWGRDSVLSPLGILGTTKHAYSEHAAFSPWTVIYNPVYKNVSIGANANDSDSFNGPISVSGAIGEFRLYPLSSGLSSSGIIGDGNSDDYIDVSIDPDTGEPVYTDPSGNVVAPPSAGGNTALPEAASNTSLIQRIVGILSDLVNRIEGIFSVAYQAISNLVGLAGPFVSRLSALYSWLPAPVLSALSSAMILAITIGVLKVFL